MEAVYSRISQLGLATTSSLSLENGTLAGFRSRISNLRGPRDFLDIHRMSKPTGIADLQSRVSFNLRYFGANYMLFLSALSVYALLTNLLLLFVLVIAVIGLLGINAWQGADLVLPRGIIITQQSLYIALGVITVPLFLIASPLSTLFWLIGAGGVTVFGHAAIMEKPLESEFAETA